LSASTIFVVEPDGAYAKRVAVKYGRQSGALMEILSGLSPGDRVIIADMSHSSDATAFDRSRVSR
jgi:HlyD family secretion protein